MIKYRIKTHEFGLLFRHGDFQRVLAPGVHRFWSRLWNPRKTSVEIVNTLDTRFAHKLLDVIVGREDVQRRLMVLDLADHERALIWKDGRLAHIVGPGRHAFWRTPYRLHVERFDVNDLRLDHAALESIVAHPEASKWLDGVVLTGHEEVLVFRDGKIIDRLRQGKYIFWKGAGKVSWKAVDLREQLADVAGQEIMTADKVTLRVNLVVTYRVRDPEAALTLVTDHAQALYREAQLVLRAAIGTRTLDALLADKESISAEVRAELLTRAAGFGVEVRSAGLRDIILPGEMKAILNQVITAEKEAQANLIKRREETAAARSQANTARVLAETPTLARLKELEMLKEVLAGTKATFVFGPTDLADQVRTLVRQPDLTEPMSEKK